MKRSSRGVPKLVEQFFQALGNGEVGPQVKKGMSSDPYHYPNHSDFEFDSDCSFDNIPTLNPFDSIDYYVNIFWGGSRPCKMLWQASMKRLRDLTNALLEMPYYLIPHLDFWHAQKMNWILNDLYFGACSSKGCEGFNLATCMALRQNILDLATMMESAGGWGSERVFSRWVAKQNWRKCLPPIFEFTVDRVTLL